jgi:hypothetical protein
MKRVIKAECETCGHDVRDHKKPGTEDAECWGGTRTNPCGCVEFSSPSKLL